MYGSADSPQCFDESSPCVEEQTAICVIDIARQADQNSQFPDRTSLFHGRFATPKATAWKLAMHKSALTLPRSLHASAIQIECKHWCSNTSVGLLMFTEHHMKKSMATRLKTLIITVSGQQSVRRTLQRAIHRLRQHHIQRLRQHHIQHHIQLHLLSLRQHHLHPHPQRQHRLQVQTVHQQL